MTPERWRKLMADEKLRLTEAEIRAGWHFCYDWDGLLIRMSNKEFECCTCQGDRREDASNGEKEGKDK